MSYSSALTFDHANSLRLLEYNNGNEAGTRLSRVSKKEVDWTAGKLNAPLKVKDRETRRSGPESISLVEEAELMYSVLHTR